MITVTKYEAGMNAQIDAILTNPSNAWIVKGDKFSRILIADSASEAAQAYANLIALKERYGTGRKV